MTGWYTTLKTFLEDMSNYFEANEKRDYERLVQMNDRYRLFKSIRPTGKGHHTDAVAIRDDRKFSIELKTRHCSIDTYPTVYIEDYKLASMLLDWIVYGVEPIYINFYDDGIVIFNLKSLKAYPGTEIKNIYSRGKEMNQQQERRYCLDLNDAVIYRRQCTTDYS